uniref:Uncharacterized protein n=1 Tax=Arundo donax TaxID=35708 RepID=A0A0A9A5X3_ARUDO
MQRRRLPRLAGAWRRLLAGCGRQGGTRSASFMCLYAYAFGAYELIGSVYFLPSSILLSSS